jgi:hypothetical protein
VGTLLTGLAATEVLHAASVNNLQRGCYDLFLFVPPARSRQGHEELLKVLCPSYLNALLLWCRLVILRAWYVRVEGRKSLCQVLKGVVQSTVKRKDANESLHERTM